METSCQLSYPLNSENASPFGTLSVYLSCAEKPLPPKTASPTAMVSVNPYETLLMVIPPLRYCFPKSVHIRKTPYSLGCRAPNLPSVCGGFFDQICHLFRMGDVNAVARSWYFHHVAFRSRPIPPLELWVDRSV